jgi:hypothetical protein
MPLPQFEYKIEELSGNDDIVTGHLNHEGRGGWELAGIVPGQGGGRYVFKRALPKARPSATEAAPDPGLIEL